MKLLNKKSLCIVYGAAALLILAGTFFDLSLSSLVVNQESLFGRFFLIFAQFPVMLCGFAASAMLLKALPEEGTERIVFTVLAAGGVLGGLIGIKEILENVSGLLKIVYILIELAIAGCFAYYVYRSCDDSNPRRLRRTALFILFTVLFTTAAVVFIKIPWGRPRYRAVIAAGGPAYQPWYKIGKSARAAYEGILDHDEFKSFPSGHTASAAYALTLIALKNCIPSLKDKEMLLTGIAFGWIILTAIARIIAGAHFLTDVTFGFLISFSVMLGIGMYLKINRKPKKN